MPAILRALNIGKSFGPVAVLKGVNMEVRIGEIHVVVGENGAGKSTLMKIFSGVHTDYEGTLEMNGRAVRFRNPMDARAHGIGMVHQELSLVPSLGALDNLFLGREEGRGPLRWMNRKAQAEKARRVLLRLGLEIDWDSPVGEFSMAACQLIEIAKSLVFDARVLILDEPTSALDNRDAQRLEELVRTLRNEGKAIL